MTNSFASYIAGKLPSNLSMSSARRLLDEARSALLLSKSKPPAPALAQSSELMAMAGSLEEIQKRAAELTAQGVAQPWLNAVVDVQSGTQPPAPKPPVKRDVIADVQREFARAKELTKAATAKPSPRPAPAAVRPAAPAKPLPPPQSSKPSMTPTTSTTTTPTANDRRLASALLDEQERREAAALVKTRAQFNLLTPAAAAAFCKAGGKIV